MDLEEVYWIWKEKIGSGRIIMDLEGLQGSKKV